MSRLEAESHQLQATGVVGVSFETHIEVMAVQAQNQGSGGFIMHCTAWGTAIGHDPGPMPDLISISPILSMRT